jgi:tetratricopeptide (TPR) repeat protein
MSRTFFTAAFACLMLVLAAYGHQSPDHVVGALTELIEADGASARLLTDRAYEQQSLGNWDAAAADFSAAVELEPCSRSAIMGYGEALLQMDELPQAESVTRRGLALKGNPASQAPFFALLARVYFRQNLWHDSLDAWRNALQSPQPEVDWFLGEERCLARLGRDPERVEALAQARIRNPSVVLQRAWIRALVDAGDHEEASLEIERGMGQSRWQSSWLLLRAQIHGQAQRYLEQQADAATALAEIRSRLNLERPDPYLVVEAAWALALLGDWDEALDYIKKAQSLGVSDDGLSALIKIVESGG